MADNSVIRYRAILKTAHSKNQTGLPDNVWAMLQTLDETADFGYYDRNQYKDRIDALEARIAELEGKR